jgi:hypothetical protein
MNYFRFFCKEILSLLPIYLLVHSIIYLYLHRFVNIYFLTWIYNTYYSIYFTVPIIPALPLELFQMLLCFSTRGPQLHKHICGLKALPPSAGQGAPSSSRLRWATSQGVRVPLLERSIRNKIGGGHAHCSWGMSASRSSEPTNKEMQVYYNLGTLSICNTLSLSLSTHTHTHTHTHTRLYVLYFLMVLGFELRASCLLHLQPPSVFLLTTVSR